MVKVQCKNRHWFDAEKYTLCPHCGAAKMEENIPMNAGGQKEPERKTISQLLFGRRETSTGTMRGSMTDSHSQSNRIVPSQQPYPSNPAPENSDIPKTELLMKPRTIQQEVKQTIPHENVISYVFSEEVKVPVAAWLVGISGTRAGRSYVVKPGVNLLVNTFARGATIAYEPEKRSFLISGEESEIYCNGFRVGSTRELNAYDMIELENEKYMFVPFCGANFDWNSINN